MNIPEYVIDIINKIQSFNYKAYVVGGCVRDILIGKEPNDWDITTNASPYKIMGIFGKYAEPTGLQHGTITIRHPNKSDKQLRWEHVEVTTFRVDGVYSDNRRPDSVLFTSNILDDLKRRDFTINAIAMGLDNKLIDPFNGSKDIENKIIRCVGNPSERFNEDALRILRALRFSAILGFEIERNTSDAIHLNKGLLRNIAPERIQMELNKILSGRYASKIITDYIDVFCVFWPELGDMVGFEQYNPNHKYDVFGHTIEALKYLELHNKNKYIIKLAMLLHDIGKPSTFFRDSSGVGHFYGHAKVGCEKSFNMLKRLRYSNKDTDYITKLVLNHDIELVRTDKFMHRQLNKFGEQLLYDLLTVKEADLKAQSILAKPRLETLRGCKSDLDRLISEADQCYTLRNLAINGNDLKKLGLVGKEIGIALNSLLSLVMDGKVENNKQALLEALKYL